MTKPQSTTKQLELRLLVEVTGRPSELAVASKAEQSTLACLKAPEVAPASDNDMVLYRQISENYFRSLRNV